ncbi:MAG: hypothetical protein AB1486_18565 [Planctomycetota bacterium]
MKHNCETYERLLADVLQDEKVIALKARVKERCHEELARRRRLRLLRWFVPAAAAALLLVMVKVIWRGDGEFVPLQPRALPAYYVSSVPLSPGQIVTTRVHEGLIVTTHTPAVVVTTTEGAAVPRIGDDEMLAFFAGAPVALVTTGKDSKKLVFLDPADEERFMGRFAERRSEPSNGWH